MDYTFQLTGLFIGANLALAAINHLKDVMDLHSRKWTPALIAAISISALLSLIASSWFYESWKCAYASIILMMAAYVVIIFFCMVRYIIIGRELRANDERVESDWNGDD